MILRQVQSPPWEWDILIYLLKLSNANSPNKIMMTPEALLIHRNHCAVNLSRSQLIAPVKTHHHSAEPRNTPHTTSNAVSGLFACPPTPMPAKMAANERIVSGLVKVSKKVEMYAPTKVVMGTTFASAAARSAGLESSVFTPK